MTNRLSKIEENLGLVISQAKRYAPTRVTDIDDYIQVGCIALMYALKKYDKSKGNWSTYAGKAIYRAIERERSRFIHKFERLKDTSYNLAENLIDILPNTLTKQEVLIIQLRLENKTFDEIADQINCTKQWVSKLMLNIYMKIREANEQKKNSIG